MFGFTRGAAVKKRSINNASQNLKPAGLVWELGKNLRMLGTRGAATLSNTPFSRNPRSAGNSHKLGKIKKTDHPKIFKKGLRENIRHLLHYHASFQQAKALNGINRVISTVFCFLQEQRPTQLVATCTHVCGAALLLLGR